MPLDSSDCLNPEWNQFLQESSLSALKRQAQNLKNLQVGVQLRNPAREDHSFKMLKVAVRQAICGRTNPEDVIITEEARERVLELIRNKIEEQEKLPNIEDVKAFWSLEINDLIERISIVEHYIICIFLSLGKSRETADAFIKDLKNERIDLKDPDLTLIRHKANALLNENGKGGNLLTHALRGRARHLDIAVREIRIRILGHRAMEAEVGESAEIVSYGVDGMTNEEYEEAFSLRTSYMTPRGHDELWDE